MLKIKEAIVVEGRYDKNTLSQVVDTLIIPVDGFQVFKRRDTVALLRRVAEKRGLIILTDSDGAGFVIRSHLKGRSRPSGSNRRISPTSMAKRSGRLPRAKRESWG